MKSQASLQGILFLRSVVNVASLFVLGVGLLILLGWSFNIPLLKSFLPGLPAVRFNTALTLILLAGSLWLLQEEEIGIRKRRAGQILAGLALLISLLTLTQYLFRWNLGIDELFFRDLD